MPRPRRKPKEFTGRNQPHRDLVLSPKWLNLVELTDYRGKAYRRFYKLETLASAVDKLVHDRDRFICPSVEKVLGAGKLAQLVFTLADEDPLRLVFHVRATSSTRKRGNLVLVVAKNAEEASRRVALEYKHLSILAERLRKDMAEPLRAGTIFMPDRHRRKDHHRELQAYTTALPTGYEPLGIHKNGQFMACGGELHTFSRRETEALKRKMVALILTAFHPIKRDGIDTHQLDPSTFQVHRPPKGLPALKLFNCVHMHTQLTPSKVIGFLLTDTWKSWGQESGYAPENPEDFYDAVVEAVGPETAAKWVAQYVRLARERKVKSPESEYVDALAELCVE